MADKVLLVCSDPSVESVSAGPYHSYAVEGGFCLVDVTPYREAEPFATASRDATEICQLMTWAQFGPSRQPMVLFRPANQAEVTTWTAKNQPAQVLELPSGMKNLKGV